MHIAQPLWLIGALVSVVLLLWSYRRLERRDAALLNTFVAARLVRQLTRSVSLRRVWVKRAAMIGAALCVCAALARPQGGYTTEIAHHHGLDILVAVDTSRSMLTPDVKPNRLRRAKLAALDLLGQLHGDAVGLVAFAGEAFLQCPITTDYDAFRDSVDALDTNTIPRGGTDIASAIHVAEATFATRRGGDKILILMTDGEDLGEQGIVAARGAGRQGIRIFTVGVGTVSGDLIPIPGANGGTSFLTDPSGQYVRSRLDAATLTQIAQATGGMYAPLGEQGQGLIAIYSKGLASYARHDLASDQIRVYEEWYQWPLFAGIVLLAAESVLLTRRKRIGARRHEQRKESAVAGAPYTRAAASTLGMLLVLGAGLMTLPRAAHASVRDAETAYQLGNYALASKEYEASARRRPAQAQLQFNVGAAAYKSGDFSTAAAAFTSALKTRELSVQQSAYYNLGNTEYRIGQHARPTQPQQAIERWQAALKSYDAALEMRPGDADAKFNRDLVRLRLAQLQQQQSQKQQERGKQQEQSAANYPAHQEPKERAGDRSKGSKGGKSEQKSEQGSSQGQNQGQSSNARRSEATSQTPSARQNAKSATGAQSPGSGNGSEAGADRAAQSGAAEAVHQQANAAVQPAEARPAPSPSQGSGQIVSVAGVGSNARANLSGGADTKSEPGQMSGEEARQLLDSLKNEERRMLVAVPGANADSSLNSAPLKDW
jgi:Ca-activated chloride channel family protein